MVKIVITTTILVLVCGCSAAMAMKSAKRPDFSVTAVGVQRADVEREFGLPVSSSTNSLGNSVCRYQYVVGNEPDMQRAVIHGVLDVFTLFLWELIGIPVEMNRGEKRNLEVEYDRNAIALTIKKV